MNITHNENIFISISSLSHSSRLSHEVNTNIYLLWHHKLGHVPFTKIKNVPLIPMKFSQKQPFTCTICPMARKNILPFPTKTDKTFEIFELLHVDLWGKYQPMEILDISSP